MKTSQVPKASKIRLVAKNATPAVATMPEVTAPLTLVIPPRYATANAVSDATTPNDASETLPNRYPISVPAIPAMNAETANASNFVDATLTPTSSDYRVP